MIYINLINSHSHANKIFLLLELEKYLIEFNKFCIAQCTLYTVNFNCLFF